MRFRDEVVDALTFFFWTVSGRFLSADGSEIADMSAALDEKSEKKEEREKEADG